ncbi:MAG: DUF4129 domain-containing protein [Sphingobacteriaceae bacterium]|nr:MAG: DUF4129 domain-containing protein [Sphingobacteriaceae bacterium]
MPKRFIAVVVLFLLTCTLSYASGKKPAVLRKDTSAVSVKKFSASALKEYAADTDFKYADGILSGPSLWSRFWNWVWMNLIESVGRSVSGLIFLKYVLPALAILGLIYIIIKATGMDITGILRPGSKKGTLPYHESLENIHEIDFDGEIETAVTQHNYRLAVRLLYLKCLKQLSDGNLIHWQPEKTNQAYYYELKDNLQRDAFGSLTLRFEYVWYGDFGIDEQAFNDINRRFVEFKKQLP